MTVAGWVTASNAHPAVQSSPRSLAHLATQAQTPQTPAGTRRGAASCSPPHSRNLLPKVDSEMARDWKAVTTAGGVQQAGGVLL